MKGLLSIGLMFFMLVAKAQQDTVLSLTLPVADTTVLLPVKVAELDSLAQRLTATALTEKQKVQAIFYWITSNIAYKVKSRYLTPQTAVLRYTLEDPADTAGNYSSLTERVAHLAYKKRVAVCDGYARLFKTLCNYSGLQCEIVTGYARSNINRIGQRFMANHTWNAVRIDSVWQLVDATWASGYTNYRGDEFIRYFDASYFMPLPRQFIRDHYPEDMRWTLLAAAPIMEEFYYTPFKFMAYIRQNIVSYAPVKGVVEAAIGDSILFELETTDTLKRLQIIDAPFIDTALLSSDSILYKEPQITQSGNKTKCFYKVTSDKVEWLTVLCNNEFVLRYKLNVKKHTAATQ